MSKWCALKVRVDCPECGSPVLVDGPYKKVVCPSCDALIAMADAWRSIVRSALDDGAPGRGFQLATLVQAGKGALGNIYVGLNKDQPPACSDCDAILGDLDGGVPDGTSGEFQCPACRAAHPTWPAPPYLQQAKVTQVFMAPPEDTHAKDRAGPEPKPVLFACANCGGNLKITAQTKRVCTCEYCDADLHLPADVWNHLHPVRRRRAFWLRCR